MKKLYILIKILFFVVVLFVALFLNKYDLFTDLIPIGSFDQTLNINIFYDYSTVLTGGSLLLFVLFFVYYKMRSFLSCITVMDKIFLCCYMLYFVIIFITKFSHYEFSGEMCQLSVVLSSIIFLQLKVFNILPIGIIIYIPILYLFFIQERRKI